MFSWSMKCWSDVLEGASTSLSAASLPTQVDLEIQYFTRPDVRWTLQLWDVYVRFKTLKIGCHVGSEEDLVESLPRRFKGSLRSHWFQFRKVGDNWNISLESCSQIFEETRKIQDSVQFMGVCVHPKSLLSCPTLGNTMDCTLPGSSVHGEHKGSNTVFLPTIIPAL